MAGPGVDPKGPLQVVGSSGLKQYGGFVIEGMPLAADPKDNDALSIQGTLLLDKGELQNAINASKQMYAAACARLGLQRHYDRSRRYRLCFGYAEWTNPETDTGREKPGDLRGGRPFEGHRWDRVRRR